MAELKFKFVAAALVSYGFLQLCGAVDLRCNVTQDGPETTYSLSQKFLDFTSNQSKYDFSWSNSTHHVVAVQGSNNTLVITSSMDTLAILGCIDTIVFTGTDYSERKDYKATCSTNCTGAALPQVPDTFPWITAWILIPIGILILLAVLCFLSYKFRDGIRRRCCCSQVGGFYTAAVKMNNPEPQVVVV